MIQIAGPAITKANLELVTLAELKTFCSITGSGDDTRMQQIVDGVNRAAYQRMRSRIIKHNATDWDLVIDGSLDGERLYLPYPPIYEFTSIRRGYYNNGTWVTDWTYDSSEYVRDDNTATLYNTATGWPRGVRCLRVVYKAGWTTCPEDLKWAILQWMSIEYKRISGDRLDQTSESDDTGGVAYTFTTVPPSALSVLAAYSWKGNVL